MSVETAATTEPTRSAETPTKVYQLQIEQVRSYLITLAAESAEQARAGWEANQYEYIANNEPEYAWHDEECTSTSVEESTHIKVEEAAVNFEAVCNALDLPYEGEED